jgi:hypothetical protein
VNYNHISQTLLTAKKNDEEWPSNDVGALADVKEETSTNEEAVYICTIYTHSVFLQILDVQHIIYKIYSSFHDSKSTQE